MRLRDRALAVFGAISLIVSIGILAGAGDASPIAGVICVLFSLAVLAVPVSALLPVMAGAAPRLGRVDVDGVTVAGGRA